METLKKPLEGRTQFIEQRDLARKDRVSTSLWSRHQKERCQARWLIFVADIRVPCGGNGPIASLVIERCLVISIDKMQVWITRGVAGSWVNVQTTEVAACPVHAMLAQHNWRS